MAPDKQKHVIAGIGIAVLAGAILGPMMGFLLASAAGALKEGYDFHKNRQAKKAGLPPPHSVEALDFVYTAAGGFAGAAFAHIALVPLISSTIVGS